MHRRVVQERTDDDNTVSRADSSKSPAVKVYNLLVELALVLVGESVWEFLQEVDPAGAKVVLELVLWAFVECNHLIGP